MALQFMALQFMALQFIGGSIFYPKESTVLCRLLLKILKLINIQCFVEILSHLSKVEVPKNFYAPFKVNL